MPNRDRSLVLPTVATCGVLIAAALCTSVAMAGTTEAAATIKAPDITPTTPSVDDALATLMENVNVVREEESQITWYSPKFQPYSSYDFRVYPIIGQNDERRRKISLQIALKDPPKGQPTSVRAALDGEPWIVPIDQAVDIKTYDSGCRTTQTLVLQNQEPFVRRMAAARQVEISLEGYRRAVRYRLTREDLDNFKRMLALWEVETLPLTKEKPAAPFPRGAHLAGIGEVTNPKLIPKSKVQPRFPQIARGKKVLGRVILAAVIRKDGTVGEIEVLQAAGGDCGFEEAAIEAVRRWRYEPGTMGGQPVDVYFTIIIEFTYGDYRMAPG